MILGIPLPGPHPDHIPEWAPLSDAISDGIVKVTGDIPETDWRSEVAAAGGWVAWYDIDEDGALGIGIGLIAHAENEDEIRRSGFCTTRPFTRLKTEIPVACIIGSLKISNADRALWAQLDWKAPTSVAPQLANTDWFIIREHPETGVPCCVFSPARWRASISELPASGLGAREIAPLGSYPPAA